MRTPSRIFGAHPHRRPCLVATLMAVFLVALPAVAFSADSVVATVPVGAAPAAIAVDPVAHRAYVANYDGDTVSVIGTHDDQVLATLPVPIPGSAFPIAVVVDPLSGKAYAGTFWSNYVSVIGPDLSTVATISPPAAHGAGVRALALDASGAATKVYAAIYGRNLVSVIDGASDTITKNVPVGGTPRALAAFSSGSRRRVYVANRSSNDVSVIDGATDSVVATVPTGAGPKAIAVDPDRGFAYVTSPASDTVTVIDDADSARATIAVGDNPIGVAVDAARRRVFVADYAQNAVTVIDADTLGVIATLPTAVQPYAVAVDQSAGRVFVTCYGGNAVTIFDAGLTPVTVPVGTRPYALGIDEGLAVHKTYAGNWGSDDVSVIDPAEGSGGPVTAGADPMPGDTTSSVSPVLTGWAASVRGPYPSAIVAVFYRLDDDPSWRRAFVTDGTGTPSVRWRAETGAIAEGPHVVHVAAMDQAMAAASSSDVGASGVSAALAAPSSYAFTIAPEPPPTPPVTRADLTPGSPDGDAGWYLTQPVVTLTPDQPVPTSCSWDADRAFTYEAPLAAPVGTHVLHFTSGDGAHGFESTSSIAVSYDPVLPYGPVLSDLTHSPGVWSRNADVVVGVAGMGDADSGLEGLAAAWAGSPDAIPGPPFDVAPLTTSLTAHLSGGAWYLSVRPRDVAGNVGPVVRSGPYLVDLSAPVTTSDAAASYQERAEIGLRATDALSGVTSTSYRLDGGDWTAGTTVTAGPGKHVLEFRSTDVAGNEEPVRSAAFLVIGRVEETNAALQRAGKWRVLDDARLSAGAAIVSEKRDAYVQLVFDGTAVDWIAPTGTGYGIARVSVDGATLQDVDLYAPTAAFGSRVWGITGLPAGPHTLRIQCTGSRNRAAKGTAVGIDAFDIVGVPIGP